MCRPAGLLKKIKGRLVIEAITESILENGLDMTKAQAASFVEAYHSNEAIRLNPTGRDVLDDMLVQRTMKMIGWKKYQSLLGSDLRDIKVHDRHQELEQKITSIHEQMAKHSQQMANMQEGLKQIIELQTPNLRLARKSEEFLVSKAEDLSTVASAAPDAR